MSDTIVHSIPWRADQTAPDQLMAREWLVANGLGGYASGSVSGVCTRRYHGLLVAALPAPAGRTVMLSHLAEALRLPDGRRVRLSGEQRASDAYELPDLLTEFRLEMGLPVWRYHVEGQTLEKRIVMPYGQNTVHVIYRLVEGHGALQLLLRPRMGFRGHETSVAAPCDEHMQLHARGRRYEVHSEAHRDLPPLRMTIHGNASGLLLDGGEFSDFFYRIESARGYPDHGRVWSPGHFVADLEPGRECTLVASTDSWDTILALGSARALQSERVRRERLLEQAHPAARTGVAAQLVLAADQFIITPFSRQGDAARAHAEGDEARTVIAGYHWFTDWGRDTMISLEGLTLATGRHAEAGYILRTFLHYVKDGLIPNMFPEGHNEGLYHTADATLWLFHAMDRYVTVTGDKATLRQALPVLADIAEHHVRGTRFGIGVDAADGLLRQGAEGYQLTWMDAKVDGWVVTPRRGKAVELNALFYNALCLLERWLGEAGDQLSAQRMAAYAERTRAAFNARFWNEATGCLYDLVDGEDGDDPAIRPNMLLAISLPHPVLDPSRWQAVLQVAQRELATPVGLRSLSPGHPDYKPTYDGDLRARDAAYHQGTVWGWLVGPFADAWLKVYPHGAKEAQQLLAGFEAHLGEACIGSISEIFDAREPFTPRGCVAQAWSVAEVLRVMVKLSQTSPEGAA
jgi:predicted glycogen debranching enzyme